MNTTTLFGWLLVTAPLLLAFTLNSDNDDFSFWLSTERMFAPNDQGIGVSLGARVDESTTFEFKAYRLADPVGFFRSQKNPHSLNLWYEDEEDTTREPRVRLTAQDKLVEQWSFQAKPKQRYWLNENVPVPVKDRGVYLVVARARGKEAATVVIVSELGLIVKQAKGTALGFVINRRTGERVVDFPLSFIRRQKNVAEGRTDGDGVTRVAIPAAPLSTAPENRWMSWGYENQVIVVGEKDGNFVISDSYFYNDGAHDHQVYLHTDRPVYRPSQNVYYRGIVRRITDDGAFENVTRDSVAVEVTDARGTSVAKDTLPLSDFGTFNGELTLGDEPPLGDYQIKTTIAGVESWFSFAVEEYKKPEYEVIVKADKEQYTRGDRITATVKADYYFGSPVSEGEVEYSMYRSRYWRPWWYRSQWAYLYEADERFYGYGMEMIHSGSGKLNADGTYTVTYTTDGGADQDYVYQIRANVVDASRRSISGSTSVNVTRGEFSITSWTDKYLYKPGDQAGLFVKIASFDGDKPVAASFNARVELVTWDRTKERRRNIWSGSGSTDASGQGSVTFTAPEQGYYNIVVQATDSRGTKIEEMTSIYVADESYTGWYSDDRGVQIIPDKSIYKPGDMLSALVIMPEAGADMLVTAEGGTIYSHQVTRLNSKSAIIRMKIDERMAPMFFINVGAIRNESFQSSMQQITVAPEGKLLRLEVKTDKPAYKPGEKGKVTVRVLNDQGEPAPNTEIALAIVDEAIFAIRPDRTPDIQRAFYGMRDNQVTTTTSLYFRYGSMSTDKDESVAEGAAIMSEQGVDGVSLRAAAPSMAKQALRDGGAAEPDYAQATLRKDFQDLMFWTPAVRTDASGRATIDVTFPDNLTTWRITARGVTQATAVGQATAEVIARKDLLVRMETPRFITAGDKLLIATTVHNYLKGAKNARVEFSGQGVEIEASEKTVSIPADGEARIDWEITAPKAGNVKLTVKALTNEESDAMEITIPVLPRGLKSAQGGIAEIDERSGNGTITLTIPANADPATSEMYVMLSPSPASSILGALDALIGYPYGCVEQTMSRFLPTVVVADALRKLDVPFDAKKQEELPKMVAKGLNRLYTLQHNDGGWGWWENDETNAFMTAYVMYGLTVARGSGYDIDQARYENGMTSLKSMIEKGREAKARDKDVVTQAYMLYVASLIEKGSGNASFVRDIRNLADEHSINNYARALLALAATYQGEGGIASKLIARLESNALVTATGAYWKGTAWHYQWQDDQVETSAFVVKALLETRGETDLVRKGVRWLVAQKEGDSWHNTRQTAMVVYALADYLKSSNELNPDYTASVGVNGRRVYSERVSRKDVFAAERQIRIDPAILRKGANTITLDKNGAGRLYATARVIYYATGDAIKPAANGFKVEREYYTLDREKRKGVYVYTKRPFNGKVRSGDEIFVKVTVRPESRYDYFMLEDPLPAGCEVITETQGYTIQGENGYDGPSYTKRGYYGSRIWNWWFADRDVRDEKVTFFATRIEPQSYTFTYIMRAQIPGAYAVMPSVGALMYYPEVRGNSGAINLTIVD